MIDGRGRARLGVEPPQPLRIGRKVSGQQLQRDGPVELRVMSPEYFAHAASTDSRVDAIGAHDATDQLRRHCDGRPATRGL